MRDLNLSARTTDALMTASIAHIADLVRKTEADVLRTPMIGRNGLDEIKEALGQLGLNLSA